MRRKCSVSVQVKKLYFINCVENEEKKQTVSKLCTQVSAFVLKKIYFSDELFILKMY